MLAKDGFKYSPIYPKDFLTSVDIHEDEDLVFVLMPFGEPHDEIYNHVIKREVQQLGMQCLRSDEIFSAKPIMQDVLQSIMTASVIIADVTGRNPNVFYELGIAHAVKDRVIIITQSMDDVPFDLKHIRAIVYDTSPRGTREFHLTLKATIETVMKQPSFPLFQVKGGAKLQYASIYQKRDELPGYGPYTKLARHEILAIGIDLDTTVRRYRTELKAKLEAEKDCRALLMVMNPEVSGQMNPMVERTAQWIRERPGLLQERIRNNLATLVDWKANLPDHTRERVEIRVYDGIGTIFLAADGGYPHGKILFGLYPYGVESNNLWPLIEFRAHERGPGIYESLYNQYKKMFEEARPWPIREYDEQHQSCTL